MNKLILLVGPTCSGKSTIEKGLNALGIPSVVSFTSRAMRPGEVDGVDYNFITREQAEYLIDTDQAIQSVEFLGNHYGSTIGALRKAFETSAIAVMIVEPTGVKQFQDFTENFDDLQIIPVYVDTPYAQLVERLIRRYLIDPKASKEVYWDRLVEMSNAYHEWPHYTQYALTIDAHSSRMDGNTAARDLLETVKSL